MGRALPRIGGGVKHNTKIARHMMNFGLSEQFNRIGTANSLAAQAFI